MEMPSFNKTRPVLIPVYMLFFCWRVSSALKEELKGLPKVVKGNQEPPTIKDVLMQTKFEHDKGVVCYVAKD
jgi:hypothetical protein